MLGVVHVPVLERDYIGGRGAGAFRRDGADSATADCRLPTGAGARAGRRQPVPRRRLARTASSSGSAAHELVAMGSSLKFCLVAEGAADVYPRLGPTSEWDTAAAQAVVEAAGGQVVDLGGRPLRYNSRETVLNPLVSRVRRPGPGLGGLCPAAGTALSRFSIRIPTFVNRHTRASRC